MGKSNITNYLLFIILFTVILFIITNICNERDNFTEKFNNIDISNYIEDNTEKLLNDKIEHELNSTNEQLKKLPEYKNGLKSRALKHKMEQFNNRLDELSNVNIEESKDIIHEVHNYIDSINKTDKDIYNSFIVDYYKEHDTKIFDEERLYNDKFNKVESHFQDTTSTDDIELETFIGKYFIQPYQYKEFNNVYMILTKKINLDTNEEEGYVLSFYMLDELVCDYEIELQKKHDNLLNLQQEKDARTQERKEEDLRKNILGYEISIIKENPNETFEFKYPKYRSGVKNMLNNLGVKENMKLYIFMVDNQFNKQYLNTDGSIDGMSKDAYFHKDDDDLFRIYGKNGATLLHLSKKNTIDKPFKSLVD